MHFEILVEDQSGKKALEILFHKLVGDSHTVSFHCYKGIGRIPPNLQKTPDPQKRYILDQLPKLLKGFGRTFAKYHNYQASVVIVMDLDRRCLKEFREELLQVVEACTPKPETQFCIAIEEGEAWLLGDPKAIKSAYPNAKDATLNSYENDSICGTWEKLADAIHPGGADRLQKENWQIRGRTKSDWAEKIAPPMNVEINNSPSFCYFRDKIRELARRIE